MKRVFAFSTQWFSGKPQIFMHNSWISISNILLCLLPECRVVRFIYNKEWTHMACLNVFIFFTFVTQFKIAIATLYSQDNCCSVAVSAWVRRALIMVIGCLFMTMAPVRSRNNHRTRFCAMLMHVHLYCISLKIIMGLNPLGAKFFRGNINIYLHFV